MRILLLAGAFLLTFSARPVSAGELRTAGNNWGWVSRVSSVGSNEAGDALWGFKFVPPAGWAFQKTASGIMLGSNTVAGLIVVFPHSATSMQQMQQEMMQGIHEEGTALSVAGKPVAVAGNALAVDYTGEVNQQQAKAKGYGVLSPNGGGAYILAITTPDKMGKDLTSAAETIGRNMQYIKAGSGAGSSDLIRFFADTWITTTTNTSTAVYLYADGTYSDHYEASYSGNMTDGGGNNTGNWGNANQQGGRGRWSVQGNKDQGKIIMVSAGGERYEYTYQVHVENGQKYYSEYYFNGTLYHRKNKYD